MNPALWKILVQGFHSSLIDEINERAPALKPELGLPVKSRTWVLPAVAAAGFDGFAVAATFESAPNERLLVFFLLDSAGARALKVEEPALWDAYCARAQATLEKWGHKITLAHAEQFVPGAAPSCAASLSQLVWIPLGVGGGKCFAGFGA